MSNLIKVLLATDTAKFPVKNTPSDSCFDLFADEDVNIPDGETRVVSTGLKFIIPEGHEVVICEKSGLASKGIMIGGGQVDEGYRGEIKVIMRYLQPCTEMDHSFFQVERGDKIAQFKLRKRLEVNLIPILEDVFNEDTERGTGGFGSSGK